MISQPTSFFIPPEIEAGLVSGDLVQFGGIVRNQLGQIVKHLKPVTTPLADKKTAARVTATLKNPRVIIPSFVVGTVAVAAARWRKQAGEAGVPQCVRDLNASLSAYVEAVHDGCLDLGTIDQLIRALDAVKAYADEDGRITLDFSTKYAGMLVNIVVDYTKQLAESNAVAVDDLEARESISMNGTVVDLRRYPKVQRKIFADAA